MKKPVYYTLWKHDDTKEMFVIPTECVVITATSSIVYKNIKALDFMILEHNQYTALGSSNVLEPWSEYKLL